MDDLSSDLTPASEPETRAARRARRDAVPSWAPALGAPAHGATGTRSVVAAPALGAAAPHGGAEEGDAGGVRLGEGSPAHLGEEVQHVHGVDVAETLGRGAFGRGVAPKVRVEDEVAPFRQEVGVGGGVGEEAVAARLHVAVKDHHHGEGAPSFGQVGEPVDPEAVRKVGELDPGEGRPLLQDPLHAKPSLPVGPRPKVREGEDLGQGREEEEGKPKPEAHAPRLRGNPSG